MKLTEDEWRRTEAIFHEAIATGEPERTTLLMQRCGQDTELMAELRDLLRAFEDEARYEAASASAEPAADMRIGPYALDRLLGRGGTGAVYLAHRADAQFEQRVAIKLIDLPLATEMFRSRFRTERQILADLSHPYIARLLDGGVSETGELFLAMEYVDGVSITRFCEDHQLDTQARIAIFLKVCEAVQYAHQKLVVHRDLKPDNVLVLTDSTPRLLDFGTAKMMQPASMETTGTATVAGLQTFTPQYASPEQVLGQPISVASDIYSLGVLLYLLLTGRLPYQLASFTTEEMIRVICTEPPVKPGVALGGEGIDGDLESILLKALRKEPQERYATVDQMSADIRARLEGRPVLARRGNLRYVAGKFIRRNRLMLVAASLLLTSVLAGTAGVLWQSHRANQERRKAEARAADLRELSNSLLSELDDALKDIPGTTGAQKLLVSRVLNHLDHAARDADGDRQTTLDLIDAYTRLGNVQSNSYYQSVGDTPGALASFGKALSLAAPLAANHPSDTEVLRAYAQALEAQGELLSTSGDAYSAADSLRAAARLYDGMIAMPGTSTDLLMEAATLYEDLGNVSGEDAGLADPEAAAVAYQRSLALIEQALRLRPDFIPAKRGVYFLHLHLGNLVLESDPVIARAEFEQSLQQLEQMPAQERQKRSEVRLHALLIRKIASADREIGAYTQAGPRFAQALAVFRNLYDADTSNVAALGDLYRMLTDEASNYEFAADPLLADATGRDAAVRRRNLQTAAFALRQCAETVRHILQLAPTQQTWKPVLADAQIRLNAVEIALGEHGIGTEEVAAALADLKKAAEGPTASADDMRMAAPALLMRETGLQRDPATALLLARRGVTLTHSREAPYLLLLAQAQQANGQAEEAAATARRGLDLLRPLRNGEPPSRVRRLLQALSSPN